jgi:hypothetical protein
MVCEHFHFEDQYHLTCEAFPGGIPEEILHNQHDHNEPYPNDNGIRFVTAKPIPEDEEE